MRLDVISRVPPVEDEWMFCTMVALPVAQSSAWEHAGEPEDEELPLEDFDDEFDQDFADEPDEALEEFERQLSADESELEGDDRSVPFDDVDDDE